MLVDTPKNFPPSGFQLGAVHLHRGWTGPVTLTDWTAPVDGDARSAHGGQLTGDGVGDETDPTLAELRAFNRHLDSLLAEAPNADISHPT